MSLFIKYDYECGVPGCDTIHREKFEWMKGTEFPNPSPPRGWVRIFGDFICPDHDVVLQIDEDEEIEIRA